MTQKQINTKKEFIRQLIIKDEMEEALEEFNKVLQIVKNPTIDQEFTALSAQYRFANKRIILNLTSDHTERNRTVAGLIHLLDQIKESVVKTEVSNSSTGFNKKEEKSPGYCIRTGEKIPFNLEEPLSKSAFRVWRQFRDPYYPENYCHFSGEASNGNTCFQRPVLDKNWDQARRMILLEALSKNKSGNSFF